MARPKLDIDGNLVESLAKIGCTVSEIASIVNCSKDTLERRFAAVIEKGRENFKMSIRRMQYQTANSGNATMQIWLGKQYLGQSDRNDVTSGGEAIKEVRWSLAVSGDSGSNTDKGGA